MEEDGKRERALVVVNKEAAAFERAAKRARRERPRERSFFFRRELLAISVGK
jgi:hypothetical protein